MITVAVSMPVRTQLWPVFVTPSQPTYGNRSQRSRSVLLSSMENALRAPIAIASF